MAQPGSIITRTTRKHQAEDPTSTGHEVIKVFRFPPEHGIHHAALDTANGEPPLSRSEVPPNPPSTASIIASVIPTAPGIAEFDIEPPPPRTNAVEGEIAGDNTSFRSWFEAEPVERPPARTERTATIAWIGRSSFGFSLMAVIGFMLFVFLDEAGKLVNDMPTEMMPPRESPSAVRFTPARLVIEGQKGFANGPLPLGISLTDASGGETVTVAGLANGTELSLGTSLGAAGWLVSARDLEKTFVGAPMEFLGIMDATVTLRSARGQLLDRQVLRLEWIKRKEGRLVAALAPAASTPLDPPPPPMSTPGVPTQDSPAMVPVLDPEQFAALINLAKDHLKHGDIATARLLLKRAAIAGNAKAALELGMTFDPAFLSRLSVVGFAPDVAQAREWYERANMLGSEDATRRLKRLASMPK